MLFVLATDRAICHMETHKQLPGKRALVYQGDSAAELPSGTLVLGYMRLSARYESTYKLLFRGKSDKG